MIITVRTVMLVLHYQLSSESTGSTALRIQSDIHFRNTIASPYFRSNGYGSTKNLLLHHELMFQPLSVSI